MKKLTLTFCAFIALFIAGPATHADGPENYAGKKEVMQPAPPVCDLYRAHEWDLSIWGAFAFAADTGRFDFDRSRESFGDLEIDPFSPDRDVRTHEAGGGNGPCGHVDCEPAVDNPDERINLGQLTKNELLARDNTWGGGVDVKYFWSKYFGAGLEGLGLASKTNFAGGGLITLTGRYPFGRFAPYITGGLGFIDGGATLYEFFNEKHDFNNGFVTGEKQEFLTEDPVYNNHVRALGQIGVGLEFRVTCHIGLMADFTWNFVFGQGDHEDKSAVVTEQGTHTVTVSGTIISSSVVINTAHNVRPGHGSDHQDFGMARFGVTFSY